MSEPLLQVRDLAVEFHGAGRVVRALNGVNLAVDKGQTLALLGESGSGKSVTAGAIMNILDAPPARVSAGEVLFSGRNLLTMSRYQRRAINGARIAMIFQDALVALNPVYSVGWQIAESLRGQGGLGRSQAHGEAVRLLDRVGIANARQRAKAYPHQFSGGQRQRVMIAMAIALKPQLLIADEPTTALDVTVQAQIMDLIMDLQAEYGMGLILITHDLGVVAEVADRVAVMYAGRIIEHASVEQLFANPRHPYTLGLLNSIPRIDALRGKLQAIPGTAPDLTALTSGCAFAARCGFAIARCAGERPEPVEVDPGHVSACHRIDQLVSAGG